MVCNVAAVAFLVSVALQSGETLELQLAERFAQT
jgi:hypothetical protein